MIRTSLAVRPRQLQFESNRPIDQEKGDPLRTFLERPQVPRDRRIDAVGTGHAATPSSLEGYAH
jgi:hypothetical protein